ncbi:hypothetical protein BD408DRAFT_420990 [Parasitella parasitica]|nr:hypothetical protein BD408DRAFT_420990 [Parasitella parasitica]
MGVETYHNIAIVTGANGGVGFGICQRLLESDGKDLTLVLACRNPARANKAKERLLNQFPFANIDIELVDVGCTKSVLSFSTSIKCRYPHINYLFCNAGILSSSGINWKTLFYLVFTDPVGLMERADVTMQPVGEINADGMGKVFAANVFGHYIMIRELESLLSKSGDGRVIWTSSITACSSSFDIDDWQGIKSQEPYESSKWACDMIAIASSERFQKENNPITSFTTSPGVVASDIGGLPAWVCTARIFLHYFMRLCGVSSQNVTAYNGAIAEVYAALEPVSRLSFLSRYNSLTNRWGKAFVGAKPIVDYDRVTAEKLIEKCELAYQAFKKNSDSTFTTAPAN